MSSENSDLRSTVVDVTYHAMEEVDEIARATGWLGVYRQLGKGPVTSRWRSLHLGRASVVTHHVDNRLHVPMAPPRGCVALAIIPAPFSMRVDGVEITKNHVIVSDAEMNVVTPDECRCDTLVLPRHVLEASAQALFPHRVSPKGGRTRLMPIPESKWSALRDDFEHLLGAGSVTPEELSLILYRFLDAMAGETGEPPRELRLGNRSTGWLASRAKDYIEDHYRNNIRLEDLCRWTGVSLRTLQRSFAEYFQVSPLEYIRTRRLDAARKALIAGDPSRDSVSKIALDSGLTHLGRFSVDYRAHFGESPKETLAKVES